MLYTIVRKCSTLDNEGEVDIQKIIKDQTSKEKKPDDTEVAAKKNRLMGIKRKVQSVAKMSKMFSTLREDSEMILKIKNISPDGKLPRGLLLEGRPAIKHAIKQFEHAAQLDKDNEKRPRRKSDNKKKEEAKWQINMNTLLI